MSYPYSSQVTFTATPTMARSLPAGAATAPAPADVHGHDRRSTWVTAEFANSPVSAVTLSANPLSPRVTGTLGDLHAAASGGSRDGGVQVLQKGPGRNNVCHGPELLTSNTLTWETQGAAAGYLYDHGLCAECGARQRSYQALKTRGYSVVADTPVTGVTLLPSAANPHLIGTPVTFTATATGGTGSVEYKFWRKARCHGIHDGAGLFTDSTWEWTAAPSDAGHTPYRYTPAAPAQRLPLKRPRS